VFVEVILVRVN